MKTIFAEVNQKTGIRTGSHEFTVNQTLASFFETTFNAVNENE